MPEAIIEVDGLVFDYGDSRALDHVSTVIQRGTITALVGPNGAGKTTLLRCLAALESPLDGLIRIDGIDTTESPRLIHRRVGFLQDFFGVYDGLTVLRNLQHAAAIQGLAADAIDPAARAAAGAVGLSDRLGQLASALSRGLRQRLAIARTIVHTPAVLLLDEPASGLDPEARHELSALIRGLNRNGMTIVVSSHILAELEDYATQMLALRSGRATGPVPVTAAGDARRRFELKALGDLAPAFQLLKGLAGVSSLAEENGILVFDLDGGEDRQSEILQALVAAGIKVSALAAANTKLEDLYLRGAGS